MVMTLAAFPPAVTLTLAGVAERVKLAGAETMSVICAVLVDAPSAPVMVTGQVPAEALATAFNVNVVVCDVEAGLKVAVMPEGSPVAEKTTAPLKPAC